MQTNTHTPDERLRLIGELLLPKYSSDENIGIIAGISDKSASVIPLGSLSDDPALQKVASFQRPKPQVPNFISEMFQVPQEVAPVPLIATLDCIHKADLTPNQATEILRSLSKAPDLLSLQILCSSLVIPLLSSPSTEQSATHLIPSLVDTAIASTPPTQPICSAQEFVSLGKLLARLALEVVPQQVTQGLKEAEAGSLLRGGLISGVVALLDARGEEAIEPVAFGEILRIAQLFFAFSEDPTTVEPFARRALPAIARVQGSSLDVPSTQLAINDLLAIDARMKNGAFATHILGYIYGPALEALSSPISVEDHKALCEIITGIIPNIEGPWSIKNLLGNLLVRFAGKLSFNELKTLLPSSSNDNLTLLRRFPTDALYVFEAEEPLRHFVLLTQLAGKNSGIDAIHFAASVIERAAPHLPSAIELGPGIPIEPEASNPLANPNSFWELVELYEKSPQELREILFPKLRSRIEQGSAIEDVAKMKALINACLRIIETGVSPRIVIELITPRLSDPSFSLEKELPIMMSLAKRIDVFTGALHQIGISSFSRARMFAETLRDADLEKVIPFLSLLSRMTPELMLENFVDKWLSPWLLRNTTDDSEQFSLEAFETLCVSLVKLKKLPGGDETKLEIVANAAQRGLHGARDLTWILGIVSRLPPEIRLATARDSLSCISGAQSAQSRERLTRCIEESDLDRRADFISALSKVERLSELAEKEAEFQAALRLLDLML